METGLLTTLQSIQQSIAYLVPEIILMAGIVTILLTGLFNRNKNKGAEAWPTLIILLINLVIVFLRWPIYETPVPLFDNMLRSDDFSAWWKIIFTIAGIFTVLLSISNTETKKNKFTSEFYILLLAALLGAQLLAMSINMIMVFISLELLSISSYILAGYSTSRKGAEGSLKYFLFGSVASAVMVYGLSLLVGLAGTLDFSSSEFAEALTGNQSPLFFAAALLTLAGFLYKISAAPMHVWAPDVYEAAPMPVLAFLSTAPKLAGLAVLTKFTLAFNLFGESNYDWQLVLAVISIGSITIGNFSALWQTNPKRMMAYSSIAQTGFLLIGITAFSMEGIQFMLFYSGIYVLSNFAVFFCLQAFEKTNVISIQNFGGSGRTLTLLNILLLIAFVSLAGLPPTAGFTSKLFIFTSLWDAYEQSGKNLLLWLLLFGLLNTVVSLFYYLKIPYYAFIKDRSAFNSAQKTPYENFLAFILVVLILFLFIQPGLLMGWLNKINFVL